MRKSLNTGFSQASMEEGLCSLSGTKGEETPPFYVQDERYVAVSWMTKSVYVQDERYVAVPWMTKSVYVQDERYVAVSWMTKSVFEKLTMISR